MKHAFLLLLAAALPAQCAPVHVSLKASAGVGTSADGFLTLAQIADLTGGTKAQRIRMASVPVGRVPLSGDTRLLTPGDISLKLRQAGFYPERDAVLEGAKQVSVVSSGSAPFLPSAGVASSVYTALPRPASPAGGSDTAPSAPVVVIHRSDSVNIVVQQGDMTITAKGLARDAGAVGQTIHVHRDGAPSDFSAVVVDAQTVQLEL